jgi:hypothetical protein
VLAVAAAGVAAGAVVLDAGARRALGGRTRHQRLTVWSHSQMVINFPGGIPLQPGRLYTWQVTIDLDANPSWAVPFFVAGPPPAPVIG